jgi:hypothetical protein
VTGAGGGAGGEKCQENGQSEGGEAADRTGEIPIEKKHKSTQEAMKEAFMGRIAMA